MEDAWTVDDAFAVLRSEAFEEAATRAAGGLPGSFAVVLPVAGPTGLVSRSRRTPSWTMSWGGDDDGEDDGTAVFDPLLLATVRSLRASLLAAAVVHLHRDGWRAEVLAEHVASSSTGRWRAVVSRGSVGVIELSETRARLFGDG